MKKRYKIIVDCANCANKMEEKINKIDGINEASINFMVGRLLIDYEDDVNEKEILKEVLKVCKKIDSDVDIN